MPFDGKASDYFETKPAPVYDRDHAPQTMWDAIRLGVRDLEATERSNRYHIDMGVAHEPTAEGICLVCFAGAIMAQTLHADPREELYFDSDEMPETWNATFHLLDHLRRGRIESWVSGQFGSKFSGSVPFTPYETDPAAFKRDMLALADRLEASA